LSGGLVVRPPDNGQRVLVVGDDVLSATWRAFRLTADHGCEGTVRWAAPKVMAGAAIQVVTTIVVPRQRVSPGWFEVPHEAVRQMGVRLREEELVNVAQLHTHPGSLVDHSPWDDERAYSRRDGALSIVWPDYGRALQPLMQWGVHECRTGNWARLSPEKLKGRIVVLPSVMDLRGAFFRTDSPHDKGDFPDNK
jgi:hypothetical protein